MSASRTIAGPSLDERLEQAIIQRIEKPRYDLWFRNHTKFVFLGEQLLVGVPNLHFQEWLNKNFGEVVAEAAEEILGHSVAVRFVIDPELFRANRAEQEKAKETVPTEKPASKTESPAHKSGKNTQATTPESHPAVKDHASKTQKRKFRTLEEFVVGTCNRVAYASAMSAVEEPGQGANPVVFYGPVGTGKTHLLEGIYIGLRKAGMDTRQVLFVTAEEFMNRFVQAMHHGKQLSFRKQFRGCVVLLIDDLTFLASKKATQIEFLHTFDALTAEGAQIVVTCDCHPRFTEDLMPELVDRLIGGAVWSLLPPDAETRLQILRRKAGNTNPVIPEEVLQFLAKQLRGNVRELEGAIHSLRHYSRATNRSIDIALAREALAEMLRHAVRVVTMADVDAAVCAVLRLPGGALRSKAKAYAISHPRMLAIFLCRKHTAATYGEISIYFGNKTHSTAVAAEKKVRIWISNNDSIKAGERDWNVPELIERVETMIQK